MGQLNRSWRERGSQWSLPNTRVDLYLLHIDPPYRHAGHYLGSTELGRVDDRLAEHQTGQGARLTRVAVANGSRLVLARTWSDVPRSTEIKLKCRTLRVHCPICKGEKT